MFIIKYFEDETFIHPKSGEFTDEQFSKFADALEKAGYTLTGGHEYYIPVLGNIPEIDLLKVLYQAEVESWGGPNPEKLVEMMGL